MAVIRQEPKCFICGESIAKAIYDENTNLIGDAFIRWEYFNHDCPKKEEWSKRPDVIEARKKISELSELMKKKSNTDERT